ncbi:hypothetical protein SAMN05444722_0937 [Rhodovulum sp. ES.010]|uniref:hypothetical protein n=1 Tax=Rhodovulum sp. ES.010 TaxID=1882821 RepID=UPI000929CE50|nr:hypothetical protein [Rhodovulum sp. ES.010]SIO23370.1 hypothetical protein SAMN05444722_0937 [Rhodovulum sp. ES.010]
MKYIWDDWLPKLASKDRITDVNIDREASTTPFSDMLGFATLTSRTSYSVQSHNAGDIELSTANPTPLSSKMGWDLLKDTGSNTELMTDSPYPLSARMGWKLLSDRKHFGVAENAQ